MCISICFHKLLLLLAIFSFMKRDNNFIGWHSFWVKTNKEKNKKESKKFVSKTNGSGISTKVTYLLLLLLLVSLDLMKVIYNLIPLRRTQHHTSLHTHLHAEREGEWKRDHFMIGIGCKMIYVASVISSSLPNRSSISLLIVLICIACKK